MPATKESILLEEKTRLRIMAFLAASRVPVEFKDIVEELGITKGNLSVHLRKLEEGGLAAISKDFVGKIPRTRCSCTSQGRAALKEYLKDIEVLLKKIARGDRK